MERQKLQKQKTNIYNKYIRIYGNFYIVLIATLAAAFCVVNNLKFFRLNMWKKITFDYMHLEQSGAHGTLGVPETTSRQVVQVKNFQAKISRPGIATGEDFPARSQSSRALGRRPSCNCHRKHF